MPTLPGEKPFIETIGLDPKTLQEPAERPFIETLDPEQPDNTVPRLNIANQIAGGRTPEQAAEILSLEMQTGLPGDFIEGDLVNVKRDMAVSGFDAEAYRNLNPRFAEWMAKNPNYYAFAKEDLNWFGEIWRSVKEQWGSVEDMERKADLVRKEMDGLELSETEKAELDKINLSSAVAGAHKEDSGKVAYGLGQASYAISQLASQVNYGKDEMARQATLGLGIGAASGAAIGAPALGVGAAPGAIVGGIAGLGLGAKTGMLSAGFQYSYNLESALAYDEMRSIKDLSGNAMPKDQLLQVAKGVGIVNAIIETGGEALTLFKFIPGVGKVIGGGKKGVTTAVTKALADPTRAPQVLAAIGKLAKLTTAEGATEGLQEFIQALVNVGGREIAQDHSGQVFADDSVSADLAGAAQQGFDAFLGSALTFGAASGIGYGAKQAMNIRDANRARNLYLALGQGVDSKAFKLLPEKAQEAVAHMVKDSKFEKVYADTGTWTEYWQSKGADPREIAAEIIGDGGKSYDQAVAQGTELEIPTERYARKIAVTEHNKFWSDELRRAPGEQSFRETAEAMQQEAKTTESAEAAIAPDQVEAELTQINDLIKQQLVAAGRTEDVAKTEATVFTERYRAHQAIRPDASPMQYLSKHLKEVRGEGMGFDVDEFERIAAEETRPLTPEEQTQAEQDLADESFLMEAEAGGVTPVLDAIREAGGLDHEGTQKGSAGEITDMNWVYRKGGLAPDRMVLSLIEAGTLPEGATPADLFGKIDAESRAIQGFKEKYGQAGYARIRNVVKRKKTLEQGPVRSSKPLGEKYNQDEKKVLESKWGALGRERKARLYVQDQITGLLNERALDKRMEGLADGTPVAILTMPIAFANNQNHDYGNSILTHGARALQQALSEQAPGFELFKHHADYIVIGELSPEQIQNIAKRVAELLPRKMQLGKDLTVNREGLPMIGIPAALDNSFDRLTSLYKSLDAYKEQAVVAGNYPEKGKPFTGAVYEKSSDGTKASPVETKVDEGYQSLVDGAGDVKARDLIYWDNGLLTKIGFDALDEKVFKAHMDVSGLGTINASCRQLADNVIAMINKAIMKTAKEMSIPVDAAHLHGDEYAAQCDDQKILFEFWSKVEERVYNESTEAVDEDGKKYQAREVGIVAGLGVSHENAEEQLNGEKLRIKAERKSTAERDSISRSGRAGGLAGSESQESSDAGQSGTGGIGERVLAGNTVIPRRSHIAGGPKGSLKVLEQSARQFSGSRSDYESAVQNSENITFEKTSEPDGTYQEDLFGQELPVPVADASSAKEQDLPSYLASKNATLTQESETSVGVDKVSTPEDAARAFGELAKSAAERLQVLVLDKDSKPIAFVARTIGGPASSQAFPEIITGETFSVPGAAAVWIGHNHPSGNASLSSQDLALHKYLANLFEGTDVKYGGFLAVTKVDGELLFAEASGGIFQKAKPSKRGKKVPIMFRELGDVSSLGPRIHTAAAAKAAADRVAGGKPGVLLVTTNGTPVAYVPINPNDASKLRGSKRMEAVYRAFAESNGNGFIVYDKNEEYDLETIKNLVGFLNAANLVPVDVIHGKTSFKETGMRIPEGKTFYQAGRSDQARARIMFDAHQRAVIELLKNADLSSFMHESAHLWASEMAEDYAYVKSLDPASLNDTQRQFLKDAEATMKWLGTESLDKLTTDQQEQFAKGFETYLFEGRAPSAALRQAFSRFRAWLMFIYKKAVMIGSPINDEMRQVFSRMLATDQEIALAQAEQGMTPLFKDLTDIGATVEEAAQYNADVQEATLEAEGQLAGKLMAQVQREKEATWQKEREKIKSDVVEEFGARKEYIALAYLQHGNLPDGRPLPEGMQAVKLSRESLLRDLGWGEGRLKDLPRPYIYQRDGGMPVAQAAELFGFSSADEMIQKMIEAEPFNKLVNRVTDDRMRSLHGDLMGDPALPEEAMKAVHNDKRVQLMRKELEYLAKYKLGTVRGMVKRAAFAVPHQDAVRTYAEQIIAEKQVKEIKPIIYKRAESKAAREAMERLLKGDFEKAFEAKRRQLLNHELYRAATEAREQVEATNDYMLKFDNLRTRQALGKAGYLEQIDAIRDRYDFSRLSTRAVEKRVALRDFIAKRQAEGFDVDLPDYVMDEAQRISYKELPYAELLGVRDAVKALDHLGRLKYNLLTEGKQRDFDAAVDEITAAVVANNSISPVKVEFAPDFKDKFIDGAKGIAAAHTRPEFLFKRLDGHKPNGVVWNYLFRGVASCYDKENQLMTDAVKKLEDIFSDYSRGERSQWYTRKFYVPELGASLTKSNLLVLALNQGNEYNKTAVLEGYKWTQNQVDAALDKLEARDWHTVQKIWDLINSFWPDIEKMEKELNGVAPDKVKAMPVETKFGEFKGGYYPIVFDPKLSTRQHELESAADINEMFGGSWARAQTRHGHTKERTNTGSKPIWLDMNGLTTHLNNVVHDLAFRREIIDVHRLINDSRVRDTIEVTVGTEMYRQLNPWLASVAGDRRAEPYSGLERILSRARKGATVVNLGWKLTSALVQTVGYTLSVKEVGPVYAMHGITAAFGNPAKLRQTWDFVTSRSGMMRDRMQNFDRDIRDALKKRGIAGVGYGKMAAVTPYTEKVSDTFFWFTGMMDRATSLPTWMAAYSKAMDGKAENFEAGNEKDAVAYADSVVRMTQSAGTAADLAAVQRGGEAFKLFTMFYSQLSLIYNQMASTGSEFKHNKDVGRLAFSLAMVWFLPAVLEQAIRGRLPDEDDDEEWAMWLAKELAFYPTIGIVLVRDIANALERYLETGRVDFSASPAFDAVESVIRGLTVPIEAARGEEITRADAKGAWMAVGYVFGIPARQIWQTTEYMHDWMVGEEEPDNVVEGVWRALFAGKKR